MKTRLAS